MNRVRETVRDEDARRVRTGALLRVMGGFANFAIPVLQLLGKNNLARAVDNFRLPTNSIVAATRAAAP